MFPHFIFLLIFFFCHGFKPDDCCFVDEEHSKDTFHKHPGMWVNCPGRHLPPVEHLAPRCDLGGAFVLLDVLPNWVGPPAGGPSGNKRTLTWSPPGAGARAGTPMRGCDVGGRLPARLALYWRSLSASVQPCFPGASLSDRRPIWEVGVFSNV